MSDPAKMLLGAMITGALRDAVTETVRKPPRPIAEDLAALQAAASRYQDGLTFEPGRLVTPRADSTLKDAGRPHIVLDIDPHAVPNKVGQTNSTAFGERLDMRVACTCRCDHGEIAAHWVESWMFEPWTPPAENAVSSPAPEAA